MMRTDAGVELFNAADRGVFMPVAGLGTALSSCFNTSTPNASFAASLLWLRLGGRRFDGALSYGCDTGIGSAIRASGVPRGEIFVVSKIGPGGLPLALGYNETLHQARRILSDLKDTHVDLLLVHEPFTYWPDPSAAVKAPSSDPSCNLTNARYSERECRVSTWRAMVTLWKGGLARSIGVSNYNSSHIEEIKEAGLPLPAVNQLQFSPHHGPTHKPCACGHSTSRSTAHCGTSPAELHESCAVLFEYLERNKIAINGYSPFDGGAKLLREPKLVSIAEAHNVTTSQVVLHWQAKHHGVLVNPTATSEQYQKLNLDFLDGFELTREEVEELDTWSQTPPPEEKGATKLRPNLVFAMADQLRWDALSYANPDYPASVKTPNLDKLASEGIQLKSHWSSTPTCTPARAALLTGRRPWGHGMLGYGAVAKHYPLVFPRLLAASGYQTVSFGKDHFGWNASTDHGIAHGYERTSLYDGLGTWAPAAKHKWTGEYDDYDKWFQSQLPGKDPQATLDNPPKFNAWNGWHGGAYIYDEKYHATAWVGRQAVEFIRGRNDTRPFLLKVSFHRPHSPYDPPARLLNAIQPSDLPPVALCKEGYGGTEPWCLRFRGNHSLGDPVGCGNGNLNMWCGEAVPYDAGILGRRAYLASVQFVDEQVGLIYKALTDTKQLQTTFVLWTADHGDGQGDMYHWRKGYPYEFSAHVPMLLRWPEAWEEEDPSRVAGVKRGTVINPPVVSELRDVFHTLIDAAGLSHNISLHDNEPPRKFDKTDGKSLLCLLRDPSGKSDCDYPPNPGAWRSWVDLEHSTCYNMSNHWSALTDGKTKYVYRAWIGDEQLFDLEADPKETIDRSVDPKYDNTRLLWRKRMVMQFEREGRGEGWVKDGELMIRTKGTTYGPNYPGGAAAGPMVVEGED